MACLAFAEAEGRIQKTCRRRERNPTIRTHPQAYQLLMNQKQTPHKAALLLANTLRIATFLPSLFTNRYSEMQNETLALDDAIMAYRGRLTGIAALHHQPCHLHAVWGVSFL